MRKIVQYMTTNHLLIRLIIVFILLGAFFSFITLKRTSYPRVDLYKVEVNTFYPGASPEDVEINVTNKVELAIKGIEGIKETTSKSMEDQSRVIITLDQSYKDIQSVKDDIRRAVDNVSDFPEEVIAKPNIFEVKVENFPIYDIAIVWDEGSYAQINEHLKVLKRKLEKLSSVSKVTISGERKKEIQIRLDLDKLNEYQVSFDDVIRSIERNKLRESGGKLESFTSEVGILTISEFTSINDLNDMIIRSNTAGKRVFLKDVAIIENSFSRANIITRYNGKKGQALWLYKRPSADIIRTIEDIKSIVNQYKTEIAPKGMEFVTTHDLSIETRDRLMMVYKNIVIGLVLVLVVLLIFFEYPIAIWTAFGIPMSIAISLCFLSFLDVGINGISLCGVIVVLGMIVDDAIIIAESVYTEKRRGTKNPVVEGTMKVFKPVMCTIMTTIIAFLPIYMIPGLVGQFTREIPIIVILILVGSLIEALFFLPSHLAGVKAKKRSQPIGYKFLEIHKNLYEFFLKILIRNRKKSSLIILVALSLALYWSWKNTKFNLFPEHQANRLYVVAKLPSGTTLAMAEQESMKFEKFLNDEYQNETRTYRTRIGRDFNGNYHCPRCFYTKVELVHFTDRKKDALQIRKEILDGIKRVYGSEIESYQVTIDSGAPPLGKDLEVTITHPDEKIRSKAFKEIRKLMESFELEVLDSHSGKQEIAYLYPLYKNISRLQTSVANVAHTIRAAYEGVVVSDLVVNNERIFYRVLLSKEDQNLKDPLNSLKVQNDLGNLIEMKKLVWMKNKKSDSAITHFGGVRGVQLTTSLSKLVPKQRKELKENLVEIIKKLEKSYSGLSIDYSGRVKKSFMRYLEAGSAFVMAIAAIYLFLVFMFKSYFLPFLILSSIPVGIVGISVAFWAHSEPISFMALIGVVGFSGVVINDALIMINLMEELKRRDPLDNLFNVIIKGAKDRYAPIFLTTVTTLAGLIPSIYGFWGGVDAFISPMVLAMASGLFLGTISDLVIIPLFYSLVYLKSEPR
jgi:multidrug efflux pump subunit AcrB